MADPAGIVAGGQDGVAFRGISLGVLIFAILVAPVGLNVLLF